MREPTGTAAGTSPSLEAQAAQQVRATELAARRGASREQVAARRQVVEMFFQWHLPTKSAEDVQRYVDSTDLRSPVMVVNGNGIDTRAAGRRGVLGFGRRPRYLVSLAVPPKAPGDVVYSLKTFLR